MAETQARSGTLITVRPLVEYFALPRSGAGRARRLNTVPRTAKWDRIKGKTGMESTGLLQRMRGFTLIEISIVLVVIGLLLSGGLLAIAPVLERTKITESNNRLDLIEDALVLYAIQHNCLPCPADGDLVTGSGNDGRSEDDAGGFYVIDCADENGGASCRADGQDNVIPWTTLGLTEADALDGWGNRFFYAVSPTLAVVNGLDRTPPSTYPPGTLTVGTTGDTDPFDNITTAAAYVVFSFGPDRSDARQGQSGATQADKYGSATQNDNSDAANSDYVQDLPINIEGNTYFDDILRWKSNPILVQQCGEGACGNP